MPITGQVELENGIIIKWLRFTDTEVEAIRLVTAQHVYVKRCWIE